MNSVPYQIGDGTFLSFPKLTVSEFLEMGQMAHLKERDRLLRDLDDANADPEIRLDRLRELDEKRELATTVIRYVFRLEGTMDVLSRSIAKMSAQNGSIVSVDDLDLGAEDLLKLACAICNITIPEISEEEDEIADENPTRIAAGTGTETVP